MGDQHLTRCYRPRETALANAIGQLVTVSHRTVSPGSTLDFNAYVSTAPKGTSVYADDASIYLAP